MDLKDLSFEEVKGLADKLDGFKYDGRWTEDKFRKVMTAWLVENPDKMPRPDLEPGDAISDDQEDDIMKSDLVKIQSKYRGEISSSFGMLDFGKDGIIEVKLEVAEMLLKLEGYDKC